MKIEELTTEKLIEFATRTAGHSNTDIPAVGCELIDELAKRLRRKDAALGELRARAYLSEADGRWYVGEEWIAQGHHALHAELSAVEEVKK